MCGVAGFVGAGFQPGIAESLLRRMANAVRHRGPDDEGLLWHARDGVGLAHRRLAVLDRSAAGTQPMESASGRLAVVFNGEICNAEAVGDALRGMGWRPRGRSDTEVLLAALETWGLVPALERLAGMFAFAVHDRHHRTLHLVRDRLGIKPLHWGWIPTAAGRMLAFASELRSMACVAEPGLPIDTTAAASMLARGCVTGEACIWRGIQKVPPGHLVHVDLVSGQLTTSCWWSAIDAAARGCMNPFEGEPAEAVERTATMLRDVTRQNLTSDVPVGCFLSGGIDSAAVAWASRPASGPGNLAAYVVGLEDPTFDERPSARRTAAALAMPLRELPVTETDMIHAVERMPETFDEPFADSSQLPTWLICREMRRHVTVALSGDGGDEVFAGYRRHVHATSGPLLWPRPVRRALAAGVHALSRDAWDALAKAISPLVPRGGRTRSPGESLHKWARAMGGASEQASYQALTLVGDKTVGHADAWWRPADAARLPDFLRRLQFMDQTGYLVDDVLVKVDRASMAHGLEVRVPLLDHRLVEFAWSLPPDLKVRHGRGKWILREMLKGHLPREVLGAPKRGFAVPLARWLRGPLRQWAGDVLDPRRLASEPLLDASHVESGWRRLQAGSDAPQHELWCVLMYLAWRDRWGGRP